VIFFKVILVLEAYLVSPALLSGEKKDFQVDQESKDGLVFQVHQD